MTVLGVSRVKRRVPEYPGVYTRFFVKGVRLFVKLLKNTTELFLYVTWRFCVRNTAHGT